VLDVENVECLEAKRQIPLLPNWEALEHGEVHIGYVGPSEHIAPQIPECSRRNAEGARVEPARRRVYLIRGPPTLRDGLLAIRIRVRGDRASYKRVGNQVGPQIVAGRIARSAASDIGKISGDLQIVGCARSSLEDVICLPVPK